MKMYEKLGVGTSYKHVTDDELKRANEVYERYVEHLRENAFKARSLAEFLLEDVDYERLDSFLWDKGELVNTSDGKLGMTIGWGWCVSGASYFAVKVETADGVKHYTAEKLTKADVPPAVLEYVKSTLKGKVHDKVDEAFKDKP